MNFQREIIDFGVSGAEGQRQLAESEHRLDFSKGRKIIELPPMKLRILRVSGAVGQRQLAEESRISGVSVAEGERQLAESEARVDLSMGRKIVGIRHEGFRGSVEFEGLRQLAESEARVNLSMGRKIFEVPEGHEGLRGSVELRDSGNSQNLSLG